ncbi:hypothetical protein FRX31_029103 [Thalictrum thalictroides]|uniref:Uncharacterized protein n=1 Tax=Thalictrum thalictroides TaxID=46969 RepID=A0A7J6VAW4_THATH|nr:hypothetical protein FRX31_029103 [Thalictrum thalictroides]
MCKWIWDQGDLVWNEQSMDYPLHHVSALEGDEPLIHITRTDVDANTHRNHNGFNRAPGNRWPFYQSFGEKLLQSEERLGFAQVKISLSSVNALIIERFLLPTK